MASKWFLHNCLSRQYFLNIILFKNADIQNDYKERQDINGNGRQLYIF